MLQKLLLSLLLLLSGTAATPVRHHSRRTLSDCWVTHAGRGSSFVASSFARRQALSLRGGVSENVHHPTNMIDFEDIIRGADADTLIVVDFSATW